MRNHSKSRQSSITLITADSLGTARARVRLVYGLACDVEHEDRMQRVDLPAADGGGATGPHPGQLLRASLGACLAMSCRLWGAREGVSFDAVEIDVVCEAGARGELDVDPTAPLGWRRVSFDMLVVTAAPAEAVRAVVKLALRTSPMLANLSADVERVFSLRIVKPETNEGVAAERIVPSDVTPSGQGQPDAPTNEPGTDSRKDVNDETQSSDQMAPRTLRSSGCRDLEWTESAPRLRGERCRESDGRRGASGAR